MILRDSLRHDAIKTLHVHEPATMAKDQPLHEAIALMQSRRVGCVIVTEHGKPIGIFTERDVLTKVLGKRIDRKTPIAKVMTSPPRVMEDGYSVAEIIRTMHHGGFRHMPVVDASGRLKGVVSVKRIVEYLVEHFPTAVFNLPPEPGQKQLAREGA